MGKPRIGIIIGSTRPGRFADTPAEWIKRHGDSRDDLEFEILDLRDYPMPFFEEEASPELTPVRNGIARQWQDRLAGFDGFVVIAAEYNRGPTAVLKNALDYAYHEWVRKPVTFVGYGGVGGARAVEQLRTIVGVLQMAPIRAAVHIVGADLSAVRNGQSLEEITHLNRTASLALDQLSWWTHALKTARDGDPDGHRLS